MSLETGGSIDFTYAQPYATPPGVGDTCHKDASHNGIRRPCYMYPTDYEDSSGNTVEQWWNKYVVTKTVTSASEFDPDLALGAAHTLEGGSPVMTTNYSYESEPEWAWQYKNSDGGLWNDYRGHRTVKVTADDGTEVTHTFGTGMWDDRTGPSNATPLGQGQPGNPLVTITEPWGIHVEDNRDAIAGKSLGTVTVRGGVNQITTVNRFDWDANPNANANSNPNDYAYQDADSLAFELGFKITQTTGFTEIFNGNVNTISGASEWVARTKVERFFDDDHGRMTREIDHGKTRFDFNPSSTFLADDRNTVIDYWDDQTSYWYMDQVEQVDLYEGTTASGALMSLNKSTYDNQGRLNWVGARRKMNNADTQNVSYTYTDRGLLETEKAHGDNSDPNDGQTTTYAYDPTYFWLKTVDGPLNGNVDLYQYIVNPVFGYTEQQTDPNGNVTTWEYDTLSRLTSMRLPGATQDSIKITYYVEPDKIDKVEVHEWANEWPDPNTGDDGYVKSWTYYDSLGREIQTQGEHDAWNPNNENRRTQVSTRYDELGRLLNVTRPVMHNDGLPGVKYDDEDWNNLGVAHTEYSYPTDVTNEPIRNGHTSCAKGINLRTSRRTAASTEWATSLTSTCGLKTRTWGPDGDANRNLSLSVSDVRGNTLSTTDPEGDTTKFEYNRRDQLIKATDPGLNDTLYTYSNYNIHGPDSTTDPDRGTIASTYDGHGRLESAIDARNRELRFEYDLGNRPTDVWHIRNSQWERVSEWKYDFTGAKGLLGETIGYNRNIDGTSRGEVKKTYSYDNRNRVSFLTYDIDGLPSPKTIGYTYFENGSPLQTTYPDGTKTNYGYDELSRPAFLGITDPNDPNHSNGRIVVNYAEYNAANQLTVLKRGQASPITDRTLNTYHAYNDESGRLYSSYTEGKISSTSLGLKQYYEYSYSPAGNIWSIHETALDSNSNQESNKQCFWYDRADRVTKGWTRGNPFNCGNSNPEYGANSGPDPYLVDYAYDNLGRITNATGPGTVGGSYTYNNLNNRPLHAPSGAGTNNYIYDVSGNRTTATVGGTSTNYLIDVQGRIAETFQAGASTSKMLYDVNGERAKRTIGNKTTYYLESGLEIDATTGDQTINMTLAGRNVATYNPDQTIWAHNTDHLGTPTYSVQGPGAASKYKRYTPFGTPRTTTPLLGFPNDITFTGQRDDGALDLMYYGARYYDPALGQFGSPDSIIPDLLRGADWNRYAYVRNNPLTYSDPTGRCPGSCPGPSGAIGAAEFGIPTQSALGTGRSRWSRNRFHLAGTAQPITPAATVADLHIALDIIGTVPGAEVADVANAGIYALERDWVNASISVAAAALPIGGQAFTASRIAARGADEAVEVAGKLSGDAIVRLSNETAGGLTNLGRGSTRGPSFFDEFRAGQGFSGVYDEATDSILAFASGPGGVVPRRGGHAVVNRRLNQALGTSDGQRAGFTAILQTDGSLQVQWLSRSVNGPTTPYVVESLRPAIIQALSTTSGRTIVG